MNSNSKPNLKFKQWKRNVKQKKKKEEEGLAGSTCSARAGQPASARAHAAQQAGPVGRSRPRTRQPRQQSLPHWPRASAARCPPARLSASPAAAANGPRLSALLCIFSTPTPNPSSDRTPTMVAGRARGHARGMVLSPPWRRAHATPHDRRMQASTAIALDPCPPITELHGRARL